MEPGCYRFQPELVINPKTAPARGITGSRALLADATEESPEAGSSRGQRLHRCFADIRRRQTSRRRPRSICQVNGR
jgi:hypothetical protein